VVVGEWWIEALTLGNTSLSHSMQQTFMVLHRDFKKYINRAEPPAPNKPKTAKIKLSVIIILYK